MLKISRGGPCRLPHPYRAAADGSFHETFTGEHERADREETVGVSRDTGDCSPIYLPDWFELRLACSSTRRQNSISDSRKADSAPIRSDGCHCQIKAVARRRNHQHERYAEDHPPQRWRCATCRAAHTNTTVSTGSLPDGGILSCVTVADLLALATTAVGYPCQHSEQPALGRPETYNW
jgi:hypothetical protein